VRVGVTHDWDEEENIFVNKNIGVNGAVSMFRQMKITELSNDPKITNEDMIELAGKMKHSPLIQLTYLRNLKLENEPT
jgi:hypothetical protein